MYNEHSITLNGWHAIKINQSINKKKRKFLYFKWCEFEHWLSYDEIYNALTTKIIWFGFFVRRHVNFRELFNVKVILVEE